MAQGKMKVKNVGFKKDAKKHPKKDLGPKKGGKVIAPKKQQKIKEKRLKQNLQKSINKSIEENVVQQAGSSSMVLVKAATGAPKKGSKEKKK